MSRRFTLIAGLGSLALTLAACGGAADDAPTTPAAAPTTEVAPTTAEETTTEEAAPTSAEETTPEETESAAAQDYDLPEGVTLPGTELKFGETATFQYTDAGENTGMIEITVLEPVEGSEADLVDAESTLPEGSTPLFITATAVGVDETAANLNGIDLSGSFRDFDTNNSSLMGMVDFSMTACTTASSLPSDFGAGSEFTSCDITWLPEGQELGGVAFQPWTMPDYEDNPVVWTY